MLSLIIMFIGFCVLTVPILAVFGLLLWDLRRNNWQWRLLLKNYSPGFLRAFWIMCGIVLPLIALGTEKITEICARSFFDPLPTDWHLLLFALIPLSNLMGELLSIRSIRERNAWLSGPLVKWINGMAIGISAFYAAWFFPMALICSTLFFIGCGATLVFWPWALVTIIWSHTHFWLNELFALFWAPPIGFVILGTLLFIPLAPFMSCLACLRTRKTLFALKELPENGDTSLVSPAVVSPVHRGFIALGSIIFAGSLYLLFKYWLPFTFSNSSALTAISPHTSFKDIFLTWAPPLIFFALLLYPSPISPLRWLPKQVVIPVPEREKGKPFERLFLPAAFALFALLAIEIPSTATRVAMSMALDPNKNTQGLLLLRAFGNDDSMLRMCYERSHATDIIGSILTWNQPIPAEKAREMYYRATGRPFNTRAVPASFRGKRTDVLDWSGLGADDVFDWDAELAGETVGGVARGISLASSDMRGEIDTTSHLAKIDWEMRFENKSKFLREARAQILLPPHAVVSNVWLWINGTAHPAAFNSRGLTRAAYRAVVRRRRDPLLVTTYGPDRVLAQCFPVPPGGTMHIKLSITTPLCLRDDGKAYLTMPIFLERNFQVASHALSLLSNDHITNPAAILKSGVINQKSFELSGIIPNQDLCLGKATVVVESKAKDSSSWFDDIANSGDIILANIGRVQAKKPEKLVVVVDGSAAMATDAHRLAQALRTMPPGIRLTLIRAGDKAEVLAEDVPTSSDAKWGVALEALQSQTFVGGQDDVTALVKAFDFIHNQEPVAILWLHGPQPVKIENSEVLADLLKHNQSHVTLYELQMENGPNRTAEALDGIGNVHRLPIIISDEAALKELFSTWTGAGEYEMSFDRMNAKQTPSSSSACQSTIDISPLWANQEIARLRALGATDKSKDAVEIAKEYRVVTPVSGAVVLETDKDYKRFGLTAPKVQVPTTKKGPLSELSALSKANPLNFGESERTSDSRRPEFEQKSASAPSTQSASTTESNSDLTSDDSSDVSAVPEPDSWLFLLGIGGVLWLFRKDVTSYFKVIRVALPVICGGMVLWTSLRWYWFRICDGTDESLGPLALVTAVLFIVHSKLGHKAILTAKEAASNWFLPAFWTIIYTILLPIAAKPVLGILMVLIVGSIVKSSGALPREKMVATVAMLLLALPLTSAFNFYCQWPLQVYIAQGTAAILGLYGFSLEVKGASIFFEGKPIVIDAACSGLHFLWFSLYLAILIAYFRQSGALRIISTLLVSLVAALVANLARVVILTFCFVIGLSGLANNLIFHQAVGIAAFLLISCLIFFSFELRIQPLFPELKLTLRNLSCVQPLINKPRVSQFSYFVICLISALATATIGHDSFAYRNALECWPDQFEGRQLVPLPLSDHEKAFEQNFPGSIAKFSDGRGEVILRKVYTPTRQLHPISECLRGAGFAIEHQAVTNDQSGHCWNRVAATLGEKKFELQERITDSAGGSSPTVSQWYWAAIFGQTKAPWLSITKVRTANLAKPVNKSDSTK